MASYEEVKGVCNHPEVYLIDVRNKDEVASTGAIPCSLNIPLPDLEQAFELSENDFKNQFDRSKPTQSAPLIFSCLRGGRAQKATNFAIEQGYTNSKAYAGSWTEWAEKHGW